MAKRIMQFRYYGEKNTSTNQPAVGASKFADGTVFKSYLPFTKLGIQALPGTKFYLNDSVDEIIIGATGIYELDLEGISKITNLTFNRQSLSLISNSSNNGLIVDVVSETGGAN